MSQAVVGRTVSHPLGMPRGRVVGPVGHGWTGALPHHHEQLLPRRAWHHHCAWRAVAVLAAWRRRHQLWLCACVCSVRDVQVYDITDRDSFENVKQWLNEIER